MKRGFTLIELMIVISIISLISAITLPRFSGMTQEAKVANVQSNLANLRTAIEMHKVKEESYPQLQGNEDALGEFSEFYSKSKLPPTPLFDGGSESNTIHETRTNGGGWLYLRDTGDLYANLPNGAYTEDSVNEIWNGESVAVVEPPKEYINNPGFEVPDQNISEWRLVNEDEVDGWSTDYPDNLIEFWKSGFQGVEAVEGDYFVELNGNGPSTIYQEIETIPGTTLTWSISHRGRTGVDVAEISVGSGGETVVLQKMEDGNTEWGTYTGTYVVPEGQTSTRFNITAISTASSSNSVGNFIDNFSVQSDSGN